MESRTDICRALMNGIGHPCIGEGELFQCQSANDGHPAHSEILHNFSESVEDGHFAIPMTVVMFWQGTSALLSSYSATARKVSC